MKKLLNEIGIQQVGYFSEDKNYIIDFENSEEFNRAFSRLQKSDLIEENEDSSVVNLDVTNILYIGEDYSLNLIADFSQDIYKLVVTPLNNEINKDDDINVEEEGEE